jgi:hypothetical protein
MFRRNILPPSSGQKNPGADSLLAIFLLKAKDQPYRPIIRKFFLSVIFFSILLLSFEFLNIEDTV